jgi:NAD(P)-dependent dehydrogenase (short-subunit alcohol dehydrogenase family)
MSAIYGCGVASILVTGSADGIGLEAGRTLIAAGHQVVLHARDDARAGNLAAAAPGTAGVVVGDVSTLAGIRAAAEAATALGPYDVVIHNVGVGGSASPRRTADGLEHIFAVNVIAPYVLTASLPPPARLVYLSSGREAEGVADLDDLGYERRPWSGMQAYSDSKLYDVILAFAVARRWPGVRSNAVDPGWIRTRMGGPNAPGALPEGADTPVWLATSDEPAALVTGRYFKERRELRANRAAYDVALQDRLLAVCADLSGVNIRSIMD